MNTDKTECAYPCLSAFICGSMCFVPVDTHPLKRSDFEIPGKDVHYVTPLCTRQRATLSRACLRPRIRPGQEGETSARRRSSPPEDRRRVHHAHQGVPARPAHHYRPGVPHEIG